MPQRERITLDGVWELRKNETNPESFPVPVPAPWQALAELRNFTGPAWYRRVFDLPEAWLEGARVILGFGAVDYLAEVWVNQHKAGDHEGGYLPFELDITPFVATRNNTLVVKVSDPPEIFAEIPHGKQSWYGLLSGIWQSVWLEKRSPHYISCLKFNPHLDGRVEVRVSLNSALAEGEWLKADICRSESETRSDAILAEVVANCTEFELKVDQPALWSVDSPNLYRLSVALIDRAGELQDELGESFGYRSFTSGDGKLWLNGEPIYLRGALDQDYYPDLICTPPSQEYIEAEFRQAKAMGLNCLRVHIKIADPRYYYAADKVGLLIWSELPSCQRLTPASRQRLRQTLEGMLSRDWNHPSIVIWTIINESWGIDLQDADQRQWLLDTFNDLKQMDPYRLVVDNSACTPNFHLQTDMDDYHHYRLIPDHRREWDQFVEDLSKRAAWTFSPFGDACRSGNEPIIVSEFGNWGLPDAERLKINGKEPWWFETGEKWQEGAVYPHGIMQRFYDYHLEQVFGSWQEFIRLTQQQEYFSLKYEIESILSRPSISGYVITEFTDVHWESNGLLDMQRNPKSFMHSLPSIVADTVIIPRWKRTAYWSGEAVEVEILLANHGMHPLPAGSLPWDISGLISGKLVTGEVSPGHVISLGMISFVAPMVEMPASYELSLRLTTAKGELLSSNSLPIQVFPRLQNKHSDITMWSDDQEWRNRLSALEYTLAANRASTTVTISSSLDETTREDLHAGARVLLVLDRPADTTEDDLGFQVREKEGSVWQGDWASTFTWLHRTGPFAQIPGAPILGYAFERVMPKRVLTGFEPHAFSDQVLAGTFVGWLQKNAAVLAQKQYRHGKLLVTTFCLTQDPPHTDPVATTLLDAMIEYIALL